VSGDYLWDGSGEPDPEIQRLEAALGPLRGTRPAPRLGPRWRQPASPFGGWPALAAAAAVLLGLAAVVTRGRSPEPASGWSLAWLEGTSWSGARVARETHLAVGEWIDTREGRARLSVGQIGEVRLEPATRVGLRDAGVRSHHLSLARGVLHATIWAPPGRFFVDTPSAVAVDLGCSYTLEVDDAGSGLLRVETGWVGFESRGLQSLVPAGAACPTRPSVGPGTPYFETAPGTLREALAAIDFGTDPAGRAAALATVLAAARPRDAFSLWHLLSRLDAGSAGRVRLPRRARSSRRGQHGEGVLRGEGDMRDAWWDELGLGSADFWRGWTTRWSDPRRGSPEAAR
jgi:hypothetical protein